MSARNNRLIKKYGITEDQYDELLRKQEGRCAVCARSSDQFKIRLSVDHDHTTGEIRGLLCTHCNRYIVGRHRKGKGDALLIAAYRYLTNEYTGWTVPPKPKRKKKKKNKKRTGRGKKC